MADSAESPRRDWLVYRGDGKQHDDPCALPAPPPWRRFDRQNRNPGAPWPYQIGPQEIDAINVAIYLRRPLLVTGSPGTGKTSLADSIAYELGLGPALKWFITTRSSLAEGLYSYDALGYFQALGAPAGRNDPDADIGRYIRLGALGTAFLSQEKPRVLLIDELDKSDADLPAELLTLFDEGQFFITELERLAPDHPSVAVFTADHGERVPIHAGRVTCETFPLIVITSNEQRDFSPSFLRRCITLNLRQPGSGALDAIVRAHLGHEAADKSKPLLDRYAEGLVRGDISPDQFLNAAYLIAQGLQLSDERLSALLFRASATARP